MSITSRINEMSSHIEQAYDELQGLGADLTNVNKNIENISMVLDDIYDSMPQVSGEGTSLTLDDTRVGKIKSTLKGNTSQEGTPTPTTPIPINVVSGDNTITISDDNEHSTSYPINLPVKNYLQNNATSTTINEVVFTKNADGTILVNGTATGQIVYNINESVILNGNYYMSGCAEGGSDTTYKMQLYGTGGTDDIGNGANISNVNGVVRIVIRSGTHCDNLIFKPMIEKGSKNNTYTPYGTTPIELCKIGTYQDYFYKDSGKWYLHKEVGKVVLDGTEEWKTASTTWKRYYYQGSNILKKGDVLSNYFTRLIDLQDKNNIQYGKIDVDYWNNDNNIFVQDYGKFDTLNTLKAWLGTHNVTLYYVLTTSTGEEITYQPLIDQLNELEKAMSKDGQTNISQVNNDLPFIISASALKEWQESTSLNSTLSMVNPLSLGNTLNTQENDIQPIEVDNIEPLEEEENEES